MLQLALSGAMHLEYLSGDVIMLRYLPRNNTVSRSNQILRHVGEQTGTLVGIFGQSAFSAMMH
jgi:hypothetical protein